MSSTQNPQSTEGLEATLVDLHFSQPPPEGEELKLYLRWEESGLEIPEEAKKLAAANPFMDNRITKKVEVYDARPLVDGKFGTTEALDHHGMMIDKTPTKLVCETRGCSRINVVIF